MVSWLWGIKDLAVGYKRFGCGSKRWLFIHSFTAKRFKLNGFDIVIFVVGLIGVNDG